MSEQSTAAVQVTSALESMKQQSAQAAKATSEQARTMKEMAKATDATAKDVKLMTRANVSQSGAAARLVEMLAAGPGGRNGASGKKPGRSRAALPQNGAPSASAHGTGNGRVR
jgi:hypothetical protein